MSLKTLMLLLLLPFSQTLGNLNEVVNSCTRYKKLIFEEEVAYSYLFADAPIMYETIDNCDNYTPLIVGGMRADPKEFPHMARLGHRSSQQNKIDWFCGGTLISDRFVLTAAHCFDSDQGEVNVVRLGEQDLENYQDDVAPVDYAVAICIKHPNYKTPQLYNDIGLIKLAEAVKFDRYKHPACLPFQNGRNVNSFIAIGWGSTSFVGPYKTHLLKVKLDRIADEVCHKVIERGDYYPYGFDGATQMCVGSYQSKDTCTGDSGGPILVYHHDYPCMYHVMGITSAGISCGTPRIPSFYTRVFYYLDWITAVISNNT